MPHANDYQSNESFGASCSEDVDQYLEHGLAYRRVDGSIEILNRKEQGDDKEETEHC